MSISVEAMGKSNPSTDGKEIFNHEGRLKMQMKNAKCQFNIPRFRSQLFS